MRSMINDAKTRQEGGGGGGGGGRLKKKEGRKAQYALQTRPDCRPTHTHTQQHTHHYTLTTFSLSLPLISSYSSRDLEIVIFNKACCSDDLLSYLHIIISYTVSISQICGKFVIKKSEC